MNDFIQKKVDISALLSNAIAYEKTFFGNYILQGLTSKKQMKIAVAFKKNIV